MAPPRPSIPPAAEDALRPCPGCGLTAATLAREGRMGCARCYDAFVPMVEEAIRELHGVAPPRRAAASPPAAAERPALPWPTRRAESARPTLPAPPASAPAPPRRTGRR